MSLTPEEQKKVDQAIANAQKWIDTLTMTGDYDCQAIEAELAKRTFNGKPVYAKCFPCVDTAIQWTKEFRDELHPRLRDQYTDILSSLSNAFWDYYLLAFYESAYSVLDDKNFEDAEFLEQSFFEAYKLGLGYVIPMGQLLVGIARPYASLDEEKRLHNQFGPAVVWGKEEEYWWHGVQVKKEWIMDKDSLDPSIGLTHPNIEERRAFCEIVGWDAILEKLNPTVLDEDPDPQIGILCETDIPDHGKQKFLRVVEESTGRRFAILAPDDATTALNAQSQIAQIPEELFRLGYVRT